MRSDATSSEKKVRSKGAVNKQQVAQAEASANAAPRPLHVVVADAVLSRSMYVVYGAAGLSLLFVLVALQWPALDSPLDYEGDTVFMLAFAKTLTEHAWLRVNPLLGLPGAWNIVDFPMPFVGQIAGLKIVAMLGLTPQSILNLYYFLTFALCGGAAAWVFQRLRIPWPLGLLGAVVYAMLPYHFIQGPRHIFLAGYFALPISCLLIMDIAGLLDPKEALPPRVALGACVALVFLNDIYYTFFFGYLVGAVALFRGRSQYKRAAMWLGTSFATAVVVFSPTLIFRHDNPDRSAALIRPPQDAENYALKLVQMFMPVPGHRNEWLAKLGQAYKQSAPLVNENASAALGILGCLALVTMSVVAFTSLWREERAATQRRVGMLAVLSLLCFLYGTFGGLSSMVAYWVTTFIRSTNRISVFISFFAILATLLWLQDHWRLAKRNTALAAVLIAFGVQLWDTYGTQYFPHPAQDAERYIQDRAFFAQLEPHLGANPKLLQLPYVAYPEGGYQEFDYWQMRPYVHTHNVSYSFGAMRGTAADNWNVETARLLSFGDPQKFLARVKDEGFTGVLFNKGIPMRYDASLVSKLQQALGQPTFTLTNSEFVYYALR